MVYRALGFMALNQARKLSKPSWLNHCYCPLTQNKKLKKIIQYTK